MKRTAKILLSAMLVLMFVFSFAGAVPAAWADYTETGAITSDNAVFLWNEETEAYDSYTGEVAIDFGHSGCSGREQDLCVLRFLPQHRS